MSEISRPWGGTTIGDAGPYSHDQWHRVWSSMVASQQANYGVKRRELNLLNAVSPVANSISIDTGRAFVDGTWYENDASLPVSVPDVASNPRIDRIVLRKDYALQTVRVTRIEGAEAASPVAPAITQVAGVTWDLPLWQIRMAVGAGAIPSIWIDEREWVNFPQFRGIDDDGVYWEDDFDSALDVPASSTDVIRGPWNVTTNNSAIVNFNNPSTGTIGVAELSTQVSGAGAGQAVVLAWIFAPMNHLARVKFRASSALVNASADFRIGWFSTKPSPGTPDPANGIYFRQTGGGNWFAVTRLSAAETATDTGIATSTSYREFEIRCRAGVVSFFIDGALVATHTTNLVPANDQLFLGWANVSSTNVNSVLGGDWTKLEASRT